MNGQYDDFQDNDQPQHIGLGSGRRKMSKNQQIYGDFYEAYQPNVKTNTKPPVYKKSAYSNFKAGQAIQNYAAECQVDIPQPRPKKKVKLIEQQQEQQHPVIGQFNLHSFLKDYQQKQQLEQIDEQQDQQSFNGPFCLNQKIKNVLKLVKIGEEDDEDWQINDGNMNINEMTFEQYRKLVMRNGKKDQQQQKRKKLTPEQKQKQKEFIQGYGKGYKMLEKMGFNLSKGLGKQEKGIQRPVEAVFKRAFTTKDSEIKQDIKKEDQQTAQQQIPAETHLFQFRSRNIKINNFLIDLKSKFESLNSKIYFYERQVQNFDRDFQINNSLKLQKQNQIQSFQEDIKKLTTIMDYGLKSHRNGANLMQNRSNSTQINHKQQLNLNVKHIYPHLALEYKMDILYIKNQYLKLKSMNQKELYEKFPDTVIQINSFLNHFYLQKQRETIKGYQQGIKSFKDKASKTINLEQEVIDLIDDRPTEEQSVTCISFQDQQKIIKFIELIAENTLMDKIGKVFDQYRHIGDIKNFKILECLRALKNLNKNSQIVQNFIVKKIKPLVFKYYDGFDMEQTLSTRKQQKIQKLKLEKQENLPHLIIFPLFQIMDPRQLQIDQLLKTIAKKLWSLKSPTLYKIIRPLLQYCPSFQRDHFLNFYLSPRLLYHLEQFDLTQPHICKQLMGSLKLYKQLLSEDILKDLLNCTIIPQIVITYKKYAQEGMGKLELTQWARRWNKQIGKILPRHFQQTLANDFHIQI